LPLEQLFDKAAGATNSPSDRMISVKEPNRKYIKAQKQLKDIPFYTILLLSREA
jgi:hypothetical protein